MLTWLLLTLTQTVGTVEVSQLTVPQYGVEGGEVVLTCLYTSLHSVYSVKWYQSGREFFR